MIENCRDGAACTGIVAARLPLCQCGFAIIGQNGRFARGGPIHFCPIRCTVLQYIPFYPLNQRTQVRKVVRGKLHGIRVTGADLDYHGSITLDPDHCEAAGILPMEFVDIWNKNSGARISTYVIYGERGSRCCILNGAAARTCQRGDEVIIANSVYVHENELESIEPSILTFHADNSINERLGYRVGRDEQGRLSFGIVKFD